MNSHQARLATPFAVLGVAVRDGALAGIDLLPIDTPVMPAQSAFVREVCVQLQAYLDDPRFRFDIPLQLGGTPFQSRVWQALRQIPSGGTESYGSLARLLGSAPRAVGQACAANPVPIVIPCHRVLGKHGLGGFMHHRDGDPLSIKRWLLQHEYVQPRPAG